MTRTCRLTRRAAPCLAVLAAGCSPPDPDERSGRAVEAYHAPVTQDVWTIVQAADFNGDGNADVLWNNAARSEMAVSLLWGTSLLESGPITQGPPGREWVAVMAADFDGDGMADVLWSQAKTNRFVVWLMAGTCVRTVGPELSGPHGDSWYATNAGDFDGDGLADVIWRNDETNRFAVWLMGGTVVRRVGPEIPGPPGRGWTVANLGDFNSDGMTDIIWHNSENGRMAIWLMRGTEVLEPGPEIPGPRGKGWDIPNASDFDADGLADVLWNDAETNRMSVWLTRGTCLSEPGPVLPGPPGKGWVAASSGDTNGDGMADATWQNLLTRRMEIWLMRGTCVLERGPELPGPS